jgi:poly-gamma-glutamate synthesis protein (capsule biosynthesis protein)
MKRLLLIIAAYFVSANILFCNDTLRLVFAGDMMQHTPQITAAKQQDGTYNYDSCFIFLANEIKYADFKVANLELTLANAPYSGYPCFSAPDAIAETLKKTGFDLLSTVNNHSCDKGAKGVNRTLDVLDKLNIRHTGTYRNIAEKTLSYPYIADVKGFRLAFLAYTYDTNGLPVVYPNIVNLIDTAEIAHDVELAKKYNPDMIICVIHWGLEYQLKQNEEQKRLADFMFARGINLIIGSHPHVIQPMEARKDSDGNITSAVVYSLGNAVSNQNQEHTDIGALAHITLVKNAAGTKISDCKYSLILRHRPTENGKTKFYIVPATVLQKRRHLFTVKDYLSMMKIFESTRKRLNADNKNFEDR